MKFYVTYVVQRTNGSEAVKYWAGVYSTIEEAHAEIATFVELMKICWHSVEIQNTIGEFV